MDKITPPNIGKIDTTPPVVDISPAEAEVHRLQKLVREHEKKLEELSPQLVKAQRLYQKEELLRSKARGTLTPEGEVMLSELSGYP